MLSQLIYVLSIMINSQNDELPYHETVKVQILLFIYFTAPTIEVRLRITNYFRMQHVFI